MAYYLINCIISFILVLVFIYRWESGVSVYFTVICLLVTIANIGYWQLARATVLEQAVLANKITYLGGCFATPCLVMCIFYLCDIEVHKHVTIFLFAVSTIIYGANLSVGYCRVFYKNVSFELQANGMYKLVKEYGPMHTAFYVMMIVYFLLCIWGLIKGFRNRRNISIKMIVYLVVALSFDMLAFFVGRKLFDYEAMPAAYNAGLILFIFIASKYSFYDVNKSVVSSLLKMEKLGVISFDKQFVYLGSNDVARKIYPAISNLYIDEKIDENDESLTELKSWIDEVVTNGLYEGYYSYDGRHYQVTSGFLYAGKKIKGYQFSFDDCTDLIRLSETDKLTGLPNRRAYETELAKIESEGKKNDLCICSFDINNLKTTNDNSGHIAGDELIAAASECIEKAFGELGTIFRTGGDEFMGIIYASDSQVEEATKNLKKFSTYWRGEYIKSMAISVGVAGTREFADYTVVQLAREADERMYMDKDEYYRSSGLERRKG